MAGTILTYLDRYGDRSFGELAFSEVDALILCQFAYLKFDGLVSDVNKNLPPIPIGKIAADPGRDSLFSDERYEKNNRKLFQKMAGSKRFGELRIGSYVNLIEEEWETQFSAVTFFLDDGIVFLAFRGTDESFVGWKEDCNMAFSSPIPSQRCALKYLNLMAGRFTGRFYLGGHSKGGNLSIYAAMNATKEIRDRILKIYNMDGPGFRPEVLEKSAYDEIEDRIEKILPHSSFIGMLFEQGNPYRVVESRNLGLFQHDPYSWIVKDDHFVWALDVYKGRKFMDKAINDWIFALSKEQIKMLTDTLFGVLEQSEAKDLVELSEDKKASILSMVTAVKEVDEDVRQKLGVILGKLFEIAGMQAIKELDRKVKKVRSSKNDRRGTETTGGEKRNGTNSDGK